MMSKPEDRAEFDRLVLRHLPEALRFATRLTADPEVAEDLVQEAITKVLERWRSFRGEAEFQTWLFRIVLNLFHDRMRRPSIGESLPDEVPDLRATEVPTTALVNELDEQIRAAITKLPPRQREVLILVACEGKRPGEVAKLLEISESKISASLYVARQQLSKALRPYLIGQDK